MCDHKVEPSWEGGRRGDGMILSRAKWLLCLMAATF